MKALSLLGDSLKEAPGATPSGLTPGRYFSTAWKGYRTSVIVSRLTASCGAWLKSTTGSSVRGSRLVARRRGYREGYEAVEGVAVTGKEMRWEYVDKNREGDHICYISDLSKPKEHYPGWKIKKVYKISSRKL